MNIGEIPTNSAMLSDEHATVSLLEKMGFILSTETEEEGVIQLKVLGRKYEKCADFFFVCGGRCRG